MLFFASFLLVFGFSAEKKAGAYSPIAENQQNKALKDIVLKVRETDYLLTKNEMEKWINENADLAFNPGYNSEIENYNFCDYKKSIVCALTFDTAKKYRIQKISRPSFNNQSIADFLDDLKKQIDKSPENAKLQIKDGGVSVFALSKNGLELNKEKSLEVLLSYFKNNPDKKSLELPYNEVEPEISTESIDNLGITSLIGEGRSNFKGSPRNRIFNIEVAAAKFDGILIRPEEEFSFVKILGPVDGEHGYLPELVIKKDKTEPEFGGGICQVSTTAFRAAIYSGLKITARKNHAYPVQYYNPQGMDATVYVPRPDLRFVNNTPGHILVQTKIVGTELIFQFYGADDGRRTKIEGPKILERNTDGSMKTTFTQKVYRPDGNLMIDDVFNSSYDSPSKYPHPGEVFTTKPDDWSKKKWSEYKKTHNL